MSAKTTAEIPGDAIIIDTETNEWIRPRKPLGLTLRDWKAWTEAEANSDYDVIARLMGSIVVDWSYDGEPSDPEAWENIPIESYFVINTSIGELIGNRTNEKKSRRKSF